MSGGLLDIAIVLLILLALVLLHELGHFLVARRAGVRVHEFGIGFPPRAAILHRGKETLYTLNWLPIGGFVRLEGEEGESVQPRAFVNQRLRTRLAILFAGVAMNFLLAWAIFTFIAAAADPVALVRIAAVQPGSPAEAAGLVGGKLVSSDSSAQPTYDSSGDLIVAIDGQRFPVFERIDAAFPPPLQYLRDHAGQEVALTVRHADGSEETLRVGLRPPDQLDQGALGITVRGLEREDIQRGPLEALAIGLRRTVEASTLILRGVADLMANLAEPQVAGPVGIVSVVGVVREALPPVFLLWLVGMLSANLAVVNILPFPPLDGGRITMSVLKAASRDRISPQTERLVYLTGFAMLMALLFWITLFDIQRAGGGA
jgi:regulator of sigma E protease